MTRRLEESNTGLAVRSGSDNSAPAVGRIEGDAAGQYQTLFDHMLDGCALHEIICDPIGVPVDYRFLAVNPAFEQMTGLSAQTIIGKTLRNVLPNTEPEWIEEYGNIALNGGSLRFEKTHAGLGKTFEVVAFQPQPGRFACIIHDVTRAREHDREVDRISRLYAVLSQVNQAIVRSQSREELFDQVCRISTQFGRFRLSQIAMQEFASGELAAVAEDTNNCECSATIAPAKCRAAQAVMSDGQPFVCNALMEHPPLA